MIFVTFSSKTDIFYYRDTFVSCLVLVFASLWILVFHVHGYKPIFNQSDNMQTIA